MSLPKPSPTVSGNIVSWEAIDGASDYEYTFSRIDPSKERDWPKYPTGCTDGLLSIEAQSGTSVCVRAVFSELAQSNALGGDPVPLPPTPSEWSNEVIVL